MSREGMYEDPTEAPDVQPKSHSQKEFHPPENEGRSDFAVTSQEPTLPPNPTEIPSTVAEREEEKRLEELRNEMNKFIADTTPDTTHITMQPSSDKIPKDLLAHAIELDEDDGNDKNRVTINLDSVRDDGVAFVNVQKPPETMTIDEENNRDPLEPTITPRLSKAEERPVPQISSGDRKLLAKVQKVVRQFPKKLFSPDEKK